MNYDISNLVCLAVHNAEMHMPQRALVTLMEWQFLLAEETAELLLDL